MSLSIVFAGPSLAAPPSDIALRPPAAAGDLLRLVPQSPGTVVLIDGVFDAVASVQHKEILELLARGWRVIGGASMGALRAAELHASGMEGVGAVFAAYASGRITADDDVAVLHAPAEFGFRPMSEALVDMRATLAVAARQRIVTVSAARMLRDTARALFWRERSWPALLAAAHGQIPDTAIAALGRWLPHGRVQLKARDARACVAAARLPAPARLACAPPPRTAFFRALAALHGVDLGRAPGGRV